MCLERYPAGYGSAAAAMAGSKLQPLAVLLAAVGRVGRVDSVEALALAALLVVAALVHARTPSACHLILPS